MSLGTAREFATDRLLSKATSTAELKTLLETEFKALRLRK
jgi:hypothetical protein